MPAGTRRGGHAHRRDDQLLICLAGRIEVALDAIWGWFTGPLFEASIDLAAAART